LIIIIIIIMIYCL